MDSVHRPIGMPNNEVATVTPFSRTTYFIKLVNDIKGLLPDALPTLNLQNELMLYLIRAVIGFDRQYSNATDEEIMRAARLFVALATPEYQASSTENQNFLLGEYVKSLGAYRLPTPNLESLAIKAGPSSRRVVNGRVID